MLFNILVLLLLVVIWHNYATTNRQLEATASAIREIWSGTCGTCQHNTRSTVKLDAPTTSRNPVGPNIACVCASCPCELIDNFLRTCAPATNVFTYYVNLLATHYYNVVKAVTSAFANLAGELESRLPCRRQDQPNNSKPNSSFSVKKSTSREESSVKENEANNKRSNETIESEYTNSSGCSRCTEKGGEGDVRSLKKRRARMRRAMKAKEASELTAHLTAAVDIVKDDVDLVIEEEITEKLSEDLIQSIERKFQVDLERSVEMILMKIKLLLQNGTTHIQDRLREMQDLIELMKKDGAEEVEACLMERQNETVALAEKALHQMVVCGYALIGHDAGQAIRNVMTIKNMIKQGIKPISESKQEVYKLLKVCGHEHHSLRKVVKCVISKSPLIKTAMMDVTSKLIDGVVGLTKLMAHGAMHEACLIEVIKSIEDEAFLLVNKVRSCTYGNSTYIEEDVKNYLKDNNATVLDLNKNNKQGVNVMANLVRRIISEDNKTLDDTFKEKLMKIQEDLSAINTNDISKDVMKKDKK